MRIFKSFLLGLAISAAITVIVVNESSCYDPHAQDSKVVREVEAAGAGNISTYSVPGLAQWFSQRPELATKIASECAPIEKVASASWATSAEGSVCYVATRTAPPAPMMADQRTW